MLNEDEMPEERPSLVCTLTKRECVFRDRIAIDKQTSPSNNS